MHLWCEPSCNFGVHEYNSNLLECSVILSIFCNWNMHSSIWNASPDVQPGLACVMTTSHAPGLVRSWSRDGAQEHKKINFWCPPKTYMKICTRGSIWSSFGSLAARSTFLTNLVVLSILPESLKHGRNYDFLEYPVLLPMFCNLNVDFQIWNANPDVKPCPACGMTSSNTPSLLMGSRWSIEA